MDVSHLTDANENLRTEIWELRETASDLELEKDETVIENQSTKEQNRSLEAKINCFKAMAEDSRKEDEELQASLSHLEETIGHLESHNQVLQETNHTLRMEIQTISSHVVCCQDYKAVQEQDLARLKQVMENIMSYFWNLKSKIETTSRLYEEEKGQVGELKDTLSELEQIQEAQEDEIVSLQGQLEEATLLKFEMDESTSAPSLLHEMVQAKLMQDSMAMKNLVVFFLSKILWLLLVTVVCAGILSFSIKLYFFVFGRDLQSGSRWVLFLDRSLELLLEVVSQRRARRPSGLRPY